MFTGEINIFEDENEETSKFSLWINNTQID